MSEQTKGSVLEGGFSLGRLAKRSASWAIVGQVVSQGLRLLSSIILAWLLFPEAFGIAAIVGVLLFGFEMLSDVGIGQSIIQNERGEQHDFLNTAWTMQIIRGGILSLAAFLLAWPVAVFYDKPELIALILLGGLGPTIQGFESTALFTQQRQLTLGSVVRLELITQVVQAVITIVWALIHPSAWALVGGTLAGTLVKTILSHRILPSIKHRFCWDIDAVRRIFRFGRWIFLSSALTFFAVQTDRILLGYFLGLPVLGIYTIALRFIEALGAFQTRLTHAVLFPFFSEVARTDVKSLVSRYYRIRLYMELLFLPASAFLVVFGSYIVELLYDDRYVEAGWMLQLLSIQCGMGLILNMQETLLFSIGHTHYGFQRSLAKAVWVIVGIPVGYELLGLVGVIWCVALVEFPTLFVIWIAMIKHRLFRFLFELRALAIWCGSTAIFYLLKSLL